MGYLGVCMVAFLFSNGVAVERGSFSFAYPRVDDGMGWDGTGVWAGFICCEERMSCVGIALKRT